MTHVDELFWWIGFISFNVIINIVLQVMAWKIATAIGNKKADKEEDDGKV